MSNTPWQQRRRQQEAVGRWIEAARMEAGLDRCRLAVAMGYRQLDRGIWRIAGWERGDVLPTGDRVAALQAALPALTRLQERIDTFLDRPTDHREALDRWAIEQELNAFVAHFPLIAEQTGPRWDNIRLHATGVPCQLSRDASLTIGQPRGLWEQGQMWLPGGLRILRCTADGRAVGPRPGAVLRWYRHPGWADEAWVAAHTAPQAPASAHGGGLARPEPGDPHPARGLMAITRHSLEPGQQHRAHRRW